MRKVLVAFLITATLIIVSKRALAQQVQVNQAVFAHIQRELAGDSSGWQYKQEVNGRFTLVNYSPQDVITQENAERTGKKQRFNIAPANENDQQKIKFLREFIDADSWPGGFYRLVVDWNPGGNGNFFEGNFILKTTETTELRKIRDLYLRITGTVTQYGKPPGGESASNCLKSGVGECRHTAAILQESLEEAGITSKLVLSPTHVWVRVTLSDPAYQGITFDLDPIDYQQPIPLPPRSQTPIPQGWQDLMVAINQRPATGLDLNGLWRTEYGLYEIIHVGNSIVGKVVKHDDKDYLIGGIGFYGTLDGTDFTGRVYLITKVRSCSRLDGYEIAFGTISADTITVNITNQFYNVDSCVYTGRTEPLNFTFTKALDPSPELEEE